MASHDQQLRNPRYRDWVKAGLALKYLKDGIQEFVDDKIKDQQKKILEEVQKEIGRPGATCNSCPIDQLRACKQDRYIKRNRCPNDVCDRIFDKIVEQHMYGKPSWSNTDSTKWCTNHWEIAKCFIDGGGYGDIVSATDTDCKGLLSIITNSMFVQRNVDTAIDRFKPKTDVFSKSKEARNKILHHASLQLPVETLNNYVDVMIQLLEDKGKLHEQKNAKQAISKLRQLKETELHISTEDEWKIREAALKAIQERKQDALDVIEKKQNDIIEKLQIDKFQETIEELSKTSKEMSHSFANRYESLEQRQTLLERSLKKHQTETSKAVIELQQDVANLKARLDAYDEIELQHKKRVTYLDHKKVVRQELFNMYTKYLSKIPVPPLLKNLDATVDEFYMELEICDDLVYEKGSQEKTSKLVPNYRAIFYKEGERVESIYVLGEAGVGKTTWCLKLIDTWLRGSTNQEIEFTHSLHNEAMLHTELEDFWLDDFYPLQRKSKHRSCRRKNEEMMLEFEFVLFVSLRHASKDVNIIDMIRNQIFQQTPQLFEYIQEIIKIEPDKCLVIADGLDEWNAPYDQTTSHFGNDISFPSRKNINHCTVLTTTRPWKLNEIQPSNSLIDRAVIIKGFGGRNCIRALAKKVIHKLNQNVLRKTKSGLKTEKNLENFEKELHKLHIQRPRKRRMFYLFGRNEYDDGVTQIPLILILLVVKWFNDGSLESTIAGNYSFMLKSLFEHEEGYLNIKPSYGRKQKLDGRLSNILYIEEAKLGWSTDAEKLPECVKKHSVCCQYSRLILKLSEIAFEGLFDRNDKALIFSEDKLLEKLSSEEVEVAVKSGILSKSDVVGTCNVSKLSFLHKTMQEFMAAIHLCANHANDNNISFQKFEKYYTHPIAITEMENLILFSSGLDANLTIKILTHVSKVENKYLPPYESMHFLKGRLDQDRGNTLNLVVKCVKELKEVSSVESMPMVPLCSFIPTDMKGFDELLDILETSVDKINIKQLKVKMDGEQGSGPNRLLDILSSEMCPLISLTTLKLEHISRTCLCTRTNNRVTFTLHNLRNLELFHINICSIGEKSTDIVLDFSHSKNIEDVNLNSLSFCQINFIGNNMRELRIVQLKCCHVMIDYDAALHAAEDEDTLFNHLCFRSYPYRFNQPFDRKTTLICQENLSCRVDINPNIRIDSVFLTDTAAPNIHWKEVKTLVLEGKIDSWTKFYAEVFDGISRSQNLTSLECIGCNQYVIAGILKAVNSFINLKHLDVTNPADKIFFVQTFIELNGSGLRILEKESKSKVLSKFSSIETLKLSKISPLLKNERVLVQSFVNLKCLKCEGFTEGDFIILGECFQFLKNLKELELSCFKWDKVENLSVFSCLEKIENLKQMKLENFSPAVKSEMSLCLPNLILSELLLGDNFQGMIQCLNNMKLLKKLSLKISCKEELLYCIGLIKNIKRIQYLTVHRPVKKRNILYLLANEHVIEKIDLSEFAHLKYFSVDNLHIISSDWQTFVSCLPKNGQLETLEFPKAVIRNKTIEQLIKSTPGFVRKKWEYVGFDEYNIILKAK